MPEVTTRDLTYWAAEEDPEKMLQNCQERARRFWRDINENPFAQQIARNYYYYYDLFGGLEDQNLWSQAIQQWGEQGELSFAAINHLRSHLRQIFVVATRDMPQPIAVASSDTAKAEQAASATRALLEQYRHEKRFEEKFLRAAEQAVVLSAGFAEISWSDDLGRQVGGDLETGRIINEGDVDFWTPTLLDVCFQQDDPSWDDLQWVITRRPVNKWDLAAKYPEQADKILDVKDPDWITWTSVSPALESDRIYLYTLWHNRTPALQVGRRFLWVEGTWLGTSELPSWAETFPVYRVAPAEVMLTPHGYSPGFGLQAPQEAYNMLLSSMVSNFDAFGVQNLWLPPGSTVSPENVQGLRLFKGQQPPQAVNLTSQPRGADTFLQFLVQQMTFVSGITDAMRGEIPKNIRNARMLSIAQAESFQTQAPFLRSFSRLIADVSSTTVRILAQKLKEQDGRVIRVAGQWAKTQSAMQIGAEDLSEIEMVTATTDNPFFRSQSARFELAEMFMKAGWIREPEEMVGLLTTGSLERILKTQESVIHGLHAENERLLRGEMVNVLKSDAHFLHFREQTAILDNPAIREDPEKARMVMSHVLLHLSMMYLPEVKAIQAARGFPLPDLGPVPVPNPEMLQKIDPRMLQAGLSPGDLAQFQMMGQSMAPPAASPPSNGRPPGGVEIKQRAPGAGIQAEQGELVRQGTGV